MSRLTDMVIGGKIFGGVVRQYPDDAVAPSGVIYTVPNLPPTVPVISGIPGNQLIAITVDTASTDAEDGTVNLYNVYVDGVLHAEDVTILEDASYNVTGLTNGVQVAVTLKAKDSGGALSAASNGVTGIPSDIYVQQTASLSMAAGIREPSTDKSWVAQAFTTLGSPVNITDVELCLYRSAGVNFDLTVELRTDNAGQPSGSVVPNSTVTIPYTEITTDSAGTWIKKVFTAPLSLSANTKYWIVCKPATSPTPVGENVFWRGNLDPDLYPNNGRRISTTNGSTWNPEHATADMAFKLYA